MECLFRFVKEVEGIFRFGFRDGRLWGEQDRSRRQEHEMHDIPQGRRERKDMRRNLERVLQAAHELFAERGTEVTIHEVARRAGVGVGTVYRRFPSKEHLFIAVQTAVCNDTQRCIQEAAARATKPEDRLRALIYTHYLRLEQQAALFDMRPDAVPSCGVEHDQPFYASLLAMLVEIIGGGQRTGGMRRGDPIVFAALALELLTPHAYANLRQILGGRAEDLAEHVTLFLLAGLRTD
jgi:AcrR family transcriptional regulator